MLYLLDANTLIEAKNLYYQFGRVPEYWGWIRHHGEHGNVKVPIEIYEEFEEARKSDGERDELSEWADIDEVKSALLLSQEADPGLVSRVIAEGYCSDPTDRDIEKMGRDPFLISCALEAPGETTIVSAEVSRPSRQRGNRMVPDVCKDLGVRCINNFHLLRELDFTTSWDSI